jgi:hypothetical protein
VKILFLIACACIVAATIGALAIGLSLFTQPEAYAARLVDRQASAPRLEVRV